MVHCPQCRQPLESPAERCPHCHAPISSVTITLPDSVASTIEIPDGAPAQPRTVANLAQPTIDLAPPAPGKPSTLSVPLPTIDLTNVLVGGAQGGQPPTPDSAGREPAATLDSAAFPPGAPLPERGAATLEHPSSQGEGEMRQRLKALWGQSSGQSLPHMTMRGSGQRRVSEEPVSTLVIRERALRATRVAKHRDSPEAGADYDLLGVLGEGGMGVVYTARQASIDREVAVKMLKPEMVRSEFQRRKFLSEAAVTGELDHPNIVPIYDLGQSPDGALFYSMKKVQGTPWSKVVAKSTLQENLETLMKVADAVAFAHSRGVIHRDLKPENIMLGEFGEVLVLDWGLAVATEGHRATPNIPSAQNIAGTPAYMAPEMATGPMELITKASDVYLLGAILYEVVTGAPPHYGKTAMDCLTAAARNKIVATTNRSELVDIARTAMATDPADRYGSVQEFQTAVREYQSHYESISLSERAENELDAATQTDDYRDYARALFAFEEAYALWSGNHKAQAGISLARLRYAGSAHRKHDYDLGLSLIEPKDPAHVDLRDRLFASKRERDARQQRLKQARRIMIALAAVIFTSVSVGIVLVTLLKLEADRQAEIARQNAFEADRQAGIATQNATEAVRQTGIAQEKERLAISARLEADARRSEAEYEAYVALIGLAAAKIEENALSQAQAALAACEPRLRGWEWRRLQYVVQQGRGRELDVGARIECLAVSNDDQRVATGSRDGAVRVWDVDGERVIHELLLRGANVYVSAIAFSPDGKQIAVGSNSPEGFLRIWDLTTGEARPLTDPQGHTATVLHVAFSRDGSKLLTASRDATARLWDVASGRPLVSYRGHSRFVWSAVFSPDETYIATASEDGTVRLWRTETGQELTDAREGRRLPFTGHRGPVYAVAFLPGDPGEKAAQIPGVGYVASAGYDKRILMWKPSDLAPFDFRKLLANETVATTPALELTGHAAAVRDLRLSPDGKRLLSASADHTLRTWYAIEEDAGYAIVKRGALDKELRGHDGPVQAAGFWRASPDAIVSAGYDGKVRFWRVGAYHEERPIPGRVLRGHLDAVMAARFSHDGQSIVTASPDRTAKKWSVADGAEQITFREGHAYLASKAFFFPDRQRLMTAAVDGAVRIWSLDKGAELLKLEGTGYRSAAALSADGQWILTGSDQSIPVTRVEGRTFAGQAAILWNASTGEKVHVLPGHKAPVTVVAFSADGEVAFSGDDNGVGVLWERESGRQLSRLEFHLGAVVGAVFAPDGKSLFTASADRTVCEWDLSDPHRVLAKTSLALQHPKAVTSLAMAGDGRRLLTGCDDGQVRLWDLATRKVAWVGETQAVDGDQLPGDVNAVAVSPDGRLALAVDSVDQIVRLFDMETGREILGTSPEGEVDHFLRLRRFEAMGWSADFAPDGQSIITVGGDEARLWDMQGVQLAAYGPHRPIIFADYSPDDVFVITAGWDQTARIWNSATGQPVLTLSAHSAGEHGGHAGAINTAVYSPDGALVLTASEDGTVRLWDVATMRVLRIYRGHTAGVTRAFFTMDAGSMITASRDGTAALWRIDDEAPLRTFAGHTGAVLDVQVSEDGKFLVTGGADNTARIWRMETGAELLKLEGHSGEVAAVAIYAGDKLRVLTGSADQTAKLWDVETPLAKEGAATGAAKELLTLRGHTRGITSVQFSPDGRAALTASRDGVAILWPTMEATDP